MRSRRVLATLTFLAVATSACGGTSSGLVVGAARPAGDRPAGTPRPEAPVSEADGGDPFGWQEEGNGVEIGTLAVPYDAANPSLGSFALHVARHRATDDSARIGSLLINPGGPGAGGSSYAVHARQIFSADIIARFDIIGWDPRGTGLSEPAVDCIDDYDDYAAGDITPDTAAERDELIDTARAFAQACQDANGEILPYIGTNRSAGDMDAIRAALGEGTISYFGFSYGSELGAVWATLYPDTVRAAVFDGAADPGADPADGLIQQSAGFEATLATFLAQCSERSSCAFHSGGDAEGAFDALMEHLDENPIPTRSGRPDLTRGMALTAVGQAMYSDTYWGDLAQGLAAARDGNGAGLLDLYDAYYRRNPDGSYGNLLEAFVAISCVDDASRPTPEEADEIVPELRAAAPRFQPGTTGSYTCSFWPAPGDQRATVTGEGAGPIVVIGTTGDAATPLASSRAMADALEDGRLVIVEADQHTGYGVNECVVEVVSAYLIDLAPPTDGTECR